MTTHYEADSRRFERLYSFFVSSMFEGFCTYGKMLFLFILFSYYVMEHENVYTWNFFNHKFSVCSHLVYRDFCHHTCIVIVVRNGR